MSSSPSSPAGQFSAPIDLRRVRQLFAAPAAIAESNFMRREIASRMHERLMLIKLAPQRVLDAGCGDGADIELLQARFANAQIVGIDASFAMAQQAAARIADTRSALTRFAARWLPGGASAQPDGALVCGDFARLPLGLHAVDLVWSNLALHWHPQPDAVFAEWRRVLRIDGLLMFSCFGPDTFSELRAAFAAVDAEAHTLPFVDMHDFGDMLVNAGFATPVMDMEKITVTYPTAVKLLADLRAFGGNPLQNRRRGLLGRAAWRRIADALEAQKGSDGRIPLTFEVIYGHAFRPQPRTTGSGESIIRLDLKKK